MYKQCIYNDVLTLCIIRHKNKDVNARRIDDPSLLKINWGVRFYGEKSELNEDDGLPPQPEDAANFFNSCVKTQVLNLSQILVCDSQHQIPNYYCTLCITLTKIGILFSIMDS